MIVASATMALGKLTMPHSELQSISLIAAMVTGLLSDKKTKFTSLLTGTLIPGVELPYDLVHLFRGTLYLSIDAM